jgi:hypothetical protein
MADDLKDAPTLQQQIQGLIKATADGLELKTKEQLNSIVLSVETINQTLSQVVQKKDFEIVGQLKADLEAVNKNLQANQVVIDNFIAEQKQRKVEVKDFAGGWKDLIQKNIFDKKEEEITKMSNDRNMKISIDLKVANMTSSSAVTGDVVSSYNNRQGLVPNQNVNMRDLLPTTPSPTGSFVTYRETGTSGSISVQTEGQSKTQIDYAFTEIKVVSKYIAGFAVVSKQLMYHLPFLQNTLPRMLLRDFYKKENDYLYDAMILAATGNAVAPGTAINDVEEILYWIANQRTADYNASYGVIDWLQWAHLLATRPGTGGQYSTPGGVTFDANNIVRVAGVPMIGASFATAGELLLWDNDYVERVETESLRVEFSYEDNDNFRKNLVTVKVECFEELNVLRPDAIIHGEFGGS